MEWLLSFAWDPGIGVESPGLCVEYLYPLNCLVEFLFKMKFLSLCPPPPAGVSVLWSFLWTGEAGTELGWLQVVPLSLPPPAVLSTLLVCLG